MPTWGNAIQAFVAAVAVKSAVDQKKANRARRKQLDEQSRLKERKTLQKKVYSLSIFKFFIFIHYYF
jgi:hypothetical protein